jgi:tetratricopeptide (TPR) repeat protein
VQERKDIASKLKAAGNKSYGSKEYNKAIDLYTKAIQLQQNPIFYSNRAACYQAMGEWDKVIEDTTAALNLDAMYVKALNRRANAYEASEKYQEALLDYTASCIVDKFSNPSSQQKVEHLLQIVAQEKAQDMFTKKEKKLPSVAFVGNYLNSFRPRPFPAGLEDTADLSKESGKGQLREALINMKSRGAAEYNEAAKAVEKALELGDLGEHEALAHNLRATFRWLMGDTEDAMHDINKSIELDPKYAQSYIKRASMHLETSKLSLAVRKIMTDISQCPVIRRIVILRPLSNRLLMTQIYIIIEHSCISLKATIRKLLKIIKNLLIWIKTLFTLTSSSESLNINKAQSLLQCQPSEGSSRNSNMSQMCTTIMVNFYLIKNSSRKLSSSLIRPLI